MSIKSLSVVYNRKSSTFVNPVSGIQKDDVVFKTVVIGEFLGYFMDAQSHLRAVEQLRVSKLKNYFYARRTPYSSWFRKHVNGNLSVKISPA